MKFNKGDLIAVVNVQNKRETAIVVAIYNKGQFAYCYYVETGEYRLSYIKEVEFVIKENFDPDFPMDDFFNLDNYFYAATIDSYTYTPFFGFPIDFGSDYDSEDDE